MKSNIETGLVHTWAYPIVMLALEAMFDTVESLDQVECLLTFLLLVAFNRQLCDCTALLMLPDHLTMSLFLHLYLPPGPSGAAERSTQPDMVGGSGDPLPG